MAWSVGDSSADTPEIAGRRLLRFRLPEAGEVATIALTGWLYGTLLTAVILLSGAAIQSGFEDAYLLLFAPQMLLMSAFAVGFVSIIWVLPNAAVLLIILRGFDAKAGLAAPVFMAITGVYALSFEKLVGFGDFGRDFWFVPLLFGAGQAYAYHRTLTA